MVKVARGDLQVMRWYRRRGYPISLQEEPLRLRLRELDLSCDDGDNGYQLALKGLGGTQVRRLQGRGQSTLAADPTRP